MGSAKKISLDADMQCIRRLHGNNYISFEFRHIRVLWEMKYLRRKSPLSPPNHEIQK